ncbi:hypothetical protein [Burkholderia diffusa]|nr:hypothetical protein [Burkholderia diffusa]
MSELVQIAPGVVFSDVLGADWVWKYRPDDGTRQSAERGGK